MVVNGFQLPDSFVKLCQDINESRTERTWLLKGRVDAYGNRLGNSDVDFITNLESIQEETDRIRGLIGWNGCFEADPSDVMCSGFVEVTSGEKLVCFGYVGSGEPFCFDFRQGGQQPSVVTWNDAYWQGVAPNFEAFLNLFAPGTDEQWDAKGNRPH